MPVPNPEDAAPRSSPHCLNIFILGVETTHAPSFGLLSQGIIILPALIAVAKVTSLHLQQLSTAD